MDVTVPVGCDVMINCELRLGVTQAGRIQMGAKGRPMYTRIPDVCCDFSPEAWLDSDSLSVEGQVVVDSDGWN